MFWQRRCHQEHCPKPGIDQCPPPRPTPRSQDPFLLTSQLNTTTGKWSPQEARIKNQRDSLQGATAWCTVLVKGRAFSHTASQQKMDLLRLSRRQIYYFWACSMVQFQMLSHCKDKQTPEFSSCVLFGNLTWSPRMGMGPYTCTGPGQPDASAQGQCPVQRSVRHGCTRREATVGGK